MGDLAPDEEALLQDLGDFLESIEVTPMTRSFKMLTLLAMLDLGALPGAVTIEDLARAFARQASRLAALREDVGPALLDERALRKLVEENPVAAWAGGRGTGGRSFFAYVDGRFRTTFEVPETRRQAFAELVRELASWRLAEYVQRPRAGG